MAVELQTIGMSNIVHTTWVCLVHYILCLDPGLFFSVRLRFVELTDEIEQLVMIDPEGIMGSLEGAAPTLELTPPNQRRYLTHLLKCQSEWTCGQNIGAVKHTERENCGSEAA